MTNEPSCRSNESSKTPAAKRSRRWVGPLIFILATAVVGLLGILAVSLMERRWETARPVLVAQPIADWEPDSAVWGQNYPREYETYMKTAIDTTKTKYGGAYPRDYLEQDPNQVILFAGYSFSKMYRQARGHYRSITDVTSTKRLKTPFNPATCWTCKSTDVPRVMNKMGVKEFYAANFHDLAGQITHAIGCQDCHDPKTMNLRITRPALREAMAARGVDVDKATHQEKRSLVCGQCHVEYYFKTDKAEGKKNYLTFPWTDGMTAEGAIEYYDRMDFADYVHAISKTRIIKAQHPDFEMFKTGVHARNGVACADCHMPYRTEGGVKFTDHHVQSPLLNIANSCAVCHRRSEKKTIELVETIQDNTHAALMQAERALVRGHFDIAAAMQAGTDDEQLAQARRLIRHAQFLWDYASANNGMGFHSPQESMRILGKAANQAQQARVLVARLLAAKGITTEPNYPDVSTRKKAWAVASAFKDGKGPSLLRK